MVGGEPETIYMVFEAEVPFEASFPVWLKVPLWLCVHESFVLVGVGGLQNTWLKLR